MQKSLWQKELVFGIIMLILASSTLPVINGLIIASYSSGSHDPDHSGFETNGWFGEEDVISIKELSNTTNGANGPLGEWPDFTPIGFITAPHPDYPQYQTHLYGDWGGIVGEEFIFLQDNNIALLYHSYHETYMTQRTHEYQVLDNWALGYDPVTKIKLTPLIQPGGPIPGPAYHHTDTPSYLHHPVTGEHLLYNSVRPGTKDDHPEWVGIPGSEGAIQVATSTIPPTMATPFTQTYENILIAEYWWEQGWNQNGEIKGGLSEPTPVWVPHLGTQGKVRLFYRGLNGAPSSYWNWRISYADSEDGKTNWTKNPIPTFDPSDPSNPAYQWTQSWPNGFSFRGAWQAHCTGDVRADGVHMVMMVSNQNYAGSGHIAYYWSPDWGDTWIGHPDNPIIAPGQFPEGVPPDGFQRTPTLLIDEEYNRYILAYNVGHDINEKWKRHTYIATASRPMINHPPELPLITGPANGKAGVSYEYTIQSIDPDSDNISYYIEWGDGTITDWTIFQASGPPGYSANHTWDVENSYTIRAKVKDTSGTESNWVTLDISMPMNPIVLKLMADILQDNSLKPITIASISLEKPGVAQ